MVNLYPISQRLLDEWLWGWVGVGRRSQWQSKLLGPTPRVLCGAAAPIASQRAIGKLAVVASPRTSAAWQLPSIANVTPEEWG